MKWKRLAIISFALILPLFVKWYFDSRDYGENLIFSRDSKPVVTKEVDELFNTETSKTTWQKGFWLGLLPNETDISPKLIFGVAPMAGVLTAAGLFFILMHYREKRKLRSI